MIFHEHHAKNSSGCVYALASFVHKPISVLSVMSTLPRYGSSEFLHFIDRQSVDVGHPMLQQVNIESIVGSNRDQCMMIKYTQFALLVP